MVSDDILKLELSTLLFAFTKEDNNMAKKRKDKKHIILKKGESFRESDERYSYRWTDASGKRHSVYAKTLSQLREKEASIALDVLDGIRPEANSTTLNDVFAIWKDVKRGVKETTLQTYCYIYGRYIKQTLGNRSIGSIKKSDIKRFYNNLAEHSGLGINAINNVQVVLHQIFSMAVDDCYIRVNPSSNAVRELKKSKDMSVQKKKALTSKDEHIFLNYIKKSKQYSKWYPIFAVMLGTGMRVGEITGLHWGDVDFDSNMISVNHALIYRPNLNGKCEFVIDSPKTDRGIRYIPMLDTVRSVLLIKKGKTGSVKNDDFVFLSRANKPFHQTALNDAINRIIKSCNQECGCEVLPHFSCHTLRHTFATRMCEKGVNMKVVQDILGHTDISITMNIYTDATNEMKISAFKELNDAIFDTNGETNYVDL